jgi:hypothetical protein
MFARQLGREIVVLVLIKIAALTAIYFLFFAPVRQHVDADSAARTMLSEDAK